MITRNLTPRIQQLAQRLPVVTLTGPRQSGKTTLCRQAFPEMPYVSLERPDLRHEVASDPLGFLAEHRSGVVIDEVQRVPELLSYIQVEVDEQRAPGRFILTGSQHFGLLRTITQSLAGRTAVVHLLPPSLAELARFARPDRGLWQLLFEGSYPAIYDRGVPAAEWLGGYVATYLERDVREVLAIQDMRAFQTFMTLCAGHTATPLNLSRLSSDVGVAVSTIKAWVGVLETSFLVIRLPTWHGNLRKRLARTPKLHFLDSGLVCWLLGIHSASQLERHPLRGAVFESWVAAELTKQRWHQALRSDLFHYRDRKGHEVDLVLEREDATVAIEVKSGATVSADHLRGLLRFGAAAQEAPLVRSLESVLVYGGTEHRRTAGVRLVPWRSVDGLAGG